MATTEHVVRASHRKAVEAALDATSGPFRRSVLSKALYPLTTPRSREKADQLADRLLREMAAAGRIQRHGHQHWVKVTQQRNLRSGRSVPELPSAVELKLTTRCPEKWVFVDLETGEVWVGGRSGWRHATKDERNEVAAIAIN